MSLEQLKEPFPAEQIHWRVGATTKDKDKGIALAYLDARNVMERLDEVVGPENWQCEYPFLGCCRIGIRATSDFETGWIWKSNGAGATDIEGDKGIYSDSFKRAAVLWGIGRYLYDLPNVWVPLEAKGRTHVIKNPPNLPTWAIPSGTPDVDPKPKSKEEEQLRYLEDLCNQHKHNFVDVVAKATAQRKPIKEVIAIYEGLAK
jgi:hypothetical protein